MSIKTPGQVAYEQETAVFPFYHDGALRRPWEKLCEIAKLSWERDPTPRMAKKDLPIISAAILYAMGAIIWQVLS